MNHDHRPYPAPKDLWICFQRWRRLSFLHWEVDAKEIGKHVPPPLELDSFDGRHFVGVVPFEMRNVRARFSPPIPVFSDFPELNVRTYVTYGGKRGVYFLSLDAGRGFFAWGGRKFFNLPYYHSSMSVKESDGWLSYNSLRRGDGSQTEFHAKYRATGGLFGSQSGSLEEFLTEKYCLFVVKNARVGICEIDHGKWPLQTGEAVIGKNELLSGFGIELKGEPLVHYADSIDVRIWPLRYL